MSCRVNVARNHLAQLWLDQAPQVAGGDLPALEPGPHHEPDASRSFGRPPAALAAPVLVLRTSRGLHRDSARHGHGVRYSFDVLPQADLQLSHDGLLDDRDRRAELHRVGPPHVRQRHEPVPRFGVHADHAADRGSVGG